MATRVLMRCPLVTLIVTLAFCVTPCQGHGFMRSPAARSSMWRVHAGAPVNYDDNGIRCGGSWTTCGVCGDPYGVRVQNNMAGGRFAPFNRSLAETYTQGEVIDVVVALTSAHRGHFTFDLCVNNNMRVKVTEECMAKHRLQVDGGAARYNVPPETKGPTDIHLTLTLPLEVTCTQCVLRWTYKAGNSYGRDPVTGEECLGCGPQETFRGCSDIAILPRHGPRRTPKPRRKTTSTTATTTTTTTTTKTTTTTSKPAETPSPALKCCAKHSVHSSIPGFDEWCDFNCRKATTLFCPESMCVCDRLPTLYLGQYLCVEPPLQQPLFLMPRAAMMYSENDDVAAGGDDGDDGASNMTMRRSVYL